MESCPTHDLLLEAPDWLSISWGFVGAHAPPRDGILVKRVYSLYRRTAGWLGFITARKNLCWYRWTTARLLIMVHPIRKRASLGWMDRLQTASFRLLGGRWRCLHFCSNHALSVRHSDYYESATPPCPTFKYIPPIYFQTSELDIMQP